MGHMPEFCQISFDEGELEAIKLACDRQSELEDASLKDSTSGGLEGVLVQEVKADDMLLIRQTVKIFKPGQKILITPEDLALVRQSLENFLDAADYALTDAIHSAITKIDGCKPHNA